MLLKTVDRSLSTSGLNISAAHKLDQVSVYDILQQEFLNTTSDEKNLSIDVSRFPKGVYFVRIRASNISTTQKIIIQ